jgi:RNA recognition motif-containing protein
MQRMSKRLYVGNLPFSLTSDKLKEIFSQFGEIESAEIVSYKDSGKSKGYGFVAYKEDASAEKAKLELNGKEVEGRKVFVNDATPFDPNKPRKPRRSFGNKRFFRRRDDEGEEKEPMDSNESDSDGEEDQVNSV